MTSATREELARLVTGLPDPLGAEVPLTAPAEGGGDGLEEAAERLGFGRVLRSTALTIVNEEAAAAAMKRRVEREGGMVLTLGEALRELPWLRERMWSLLDPRRDRYTAAVALAEQEGRATGYVVYIPRRVRIGFPIYVCLLLTRSGAQLLHNLIILEEDAEATLVTGCGAPYRLQGVHIGVTEAWLARGATLRYAMIHAWGPRLHVRPRTAVAIEKDANMISYYMVYGEVASLHTEPRYLVHGGSLYSASVVAAEGRSIYHVGAAAELTAPGASAELVSRLIARDEARVTSPLKLVARAPGRGHVECLGLPLSPRATISSIPVLESHVDTAELSHEAAIGRLRGEELEYLMARGLTEEEARSLLLRGFLHVEVPGLPKPVKALIEATEKMLAQRGAA